jgi:type IV secretion system protein TrbI
VDISTNNGQNAEEVEEAYHLPLRPGRPAVTRINRRTILVMGFLAATLGAVILVAGFSDHRHSGRLGPEQENTQRPNGPLEATRDLPNDYSFDVRQAASGVSYEMPTFSAPAPAQLATTRPTGPTAEEMAAAAELRRQAELREKLLEQQRKEMEQALDSPLLFAGAKATDSKVPSVQPSAPANLPMLAMQPPAPIPIYPPGGTDQSAIAPSGLRQNLQREKEEFLTKGNDVETYLQKPLLQPISAYELKAGTVIPGALITAINTDLPGEIIGQVTENVYDTKSGKYLLVPQGTKLLGKYSSLVSNGQNRALIVWTRLIMPNGNSIVVGGMPGTDQAGQAGLKDGVDYHLGQLASAVGLTTAIAYGGNLARSPSERSGNSNSDVIGDTVAQQSNRVGEKFIDRELDVQPTITVRAGWKFNVLVNKDMVLAPYTDADVSK